MRLLFIDGSTHVETVQEMRLKPRGGMVGSLFRVTDYLASRGHDVSICGDIKTEGVTDAGVRWMRNRHERGRYDCLITNRGVGDGYPDVDADARVLWTHDLPHSGFAPSPEVLRAFRLTVFMSEYAERVWREFYRDIGKSVTIPNGVDKSLFYPREKDMKYLIFMSHPIRGLSKLPMVVGAIAERVKGVYCRAYSNKHGMYPSGDDAGYVDPWQAQDVPAPLQILDPLPLAQIAEQVGRAGLCIMPTGYPEICSNSILQCMASGTPVITTGNLGSACEWVRHRKSGMMTKFQPHDYMVHTMEMVRNAVEVLEGESLHRRLISGAFNTKVLSWEEVGVKWEKALSRCI